MVMLKETTLRYAGLDREIDSDNLNHRFDIAAHGIALGTLPVVTSPTDGQTVDAQIARAHRLVSQRLRAWADILDDHARALEGR